MSAVNAIIEKPKHKFRKLSKVERAELKQKFGGRCAYCGEMLPEKWHADHFEAIGRELRWERGAGFRPTGHVLYPGRDTIANFMPSCVACNIDKGPMAIETWRQVLSRRVEVLNKNYSAYRHAKRFGLIVETGAEISFYFERAVIQSEGK